MKLSNDIYGGLSPVDVALYTYSEAARILRIPISTLRAWTVGQYYIARGDRQFFHPLIEKPEAELPRLSFANIIEAFVLRALRTVHSVQLITIRKALDIAQDAHGIDRLLIHPQLKTAAGRVFLDEVSQLEDLSPSRQLVLREVLSAYLRRVEWEDGGMPMWLNPFPCRPQHREQLIVGINPTISFGRPLIRRVGVTTHIVALRYDSGEDKQTIIRDYGLKEFEFNEALYFEGAA